MFVDVVEAPVVVEAPRVPLNKSQLHAKAMAWLLESMRRYKYVLGTSDEFEARIFKRLDKIMSAETQEDAEKLAYEAEDEGTLLISVWQKKV